ncbi:MAG: peptide chain release factor 1, partial [Solirubrobacteraceae bacterium]|nr:peptide chain release factor 1 [Solirubrobacteraceae bacterium]
MLDALVEQIRLRFVESEAAMSDPEVIADRNKYADAGRRYNHLKPANALAEEWVQMTGDADG